MTRNGNRSHLILSINLLLLTITLFQPILFWVFILVFVSVAIRVALFFDWHKHLPSVNTINLLALLAAIVLAYTGWQAGLLLSMVNLLVMSGALKLMMMRKVRDYFLLILVELFIIGCGLIFNQTIFYALLYSGSVFLIFISLCYHVSPSANLTKHCKLVSKLCLQSIPVCLLLFLILPQLAPLWKMPTQRSAETGIAEQVTPGDFAQLSKSDDLVFRASFEDEFPEKHDLYWRTLVYEQFDGKTWSISKLREREKLRMQLGRIQFSPPLTGRAFSYEVIMEANHQKWLYVLDIARPVTEQTWLSYDYQLQSKLPIATKFKYELMSFPEARLNAAPYYIDRQINLMVPASKSNQRTKKWVADLRATFPDNRQFITAVESYLKRQQFRYTLNPSPMPVDPVDDFLFEKQSGFCAHYASAYAYVMRLAGIPARVVGGYQGGENREDSYISVHQYDAHAWVEILDSELGWIRKDPTALISPDRISLGLEGAVAWENSFLEDQAFSLARLKSIEILNQLRLLMADIDFFWSSWVLGFDQQRQLKMFKSLMGKINPTRLAMLSLAVLFTIILLLAVFNFRVWYPKIVNPHLHYYNLALATITRYGHKRRLSEGPESFASRIAPDLPERCAEDFRYITKLFVFHEYAPGSKTNPNRLPELKLAVRSFRRRYRFTLK